MKYLPIVATLTMMVLSGCWQIWNAGDLSEWVREQAVEEGCDPTTIELNEWYDATEEGSVWSGTCVNTASGESMTFSINVDAVWTPSEPAAPADGVPDANPAGLSEEALRNATYTFELYDDPIILADGHWEGDPYVEGGASRPMVDYMAGSTLFGDLDGDGVDDGVAFLSESGGGSGNFAYVAAQLNRDGRPVDAGTVLLEDRVQIKSAVIEDGQILVEAIVPGPGDGACCPSHKANRVYAVEDGMLAAVTPEGGELVKVSAADLDGTSWTLIQLADGQPALADTAITIQFEDGMIAGSAGCNSYSTAYTLSEDNPFLITLEPVIATQMACPDPILNQETEYLSALETVTIWGYRFGELALRYSAADGTPALMFFAPSQPADMVSEDMPADTNTDTLIGQTWQWVGFTSPVEQVEIETPESYTVTFNEDGSMSVAADYMLDNLFSLPGTLAAD